MYGEFVCTCLGIAMLAISFLAICISIAVIAYAKSIFHETHIDEINYALWLKETKNNE